MILDIQFTTILSLVISALSLLGVGTIFATLWKEFFAKKDEKKQAKLEDEKKFEALNLGLQALLRAELIKIYNEGIKKGYAHIYERENFENCYKQYENLGANGVMTGIHDIYMKLPTEKASRIKLNENKEN